MPIVYLRHVSRAMVRADRATLYVFGDNFAGEGFGGQAAEMRGEPNAVGIPTKRRPARDPGAYLTDDDLPRFKRAAARAFSRLADHLRAGGEVVWPLDGIGTGRAELAERAPRVWASLERARARLEAIVIVQERYDAQRDFDEALMPGGFN